MSLLTVQFVGANGIFPRLIELKGSGPYSHVDIVLPSGALLGARIDRIGGKPSGVQIRPADYEDWKIKTRISVAATDDEAARFWSFALSQEGKPYDRMAILSFVLNRDWMEESAWICSELVMAAFDKATIFRSPLITAEAKIDPCTAFSILSTWSTWGNGAS